MPLGQLLVQAVNIALPQLAGQDKLIPISMDPDEVAGVERGTGQQAVHLFLRQVPDAFTLAQTDNIAIVEQQLTEHCSRLSHFQRVELLEAIAA